MNADDLRVLNRDAVAQVLRQHLPDRIYEMGCRLACGYDGSDMDEHLAAQVIATVCPPGSATVFNRDAVVEVLHKAHHNTRCTWPASLSTPCPLLDEAQAEADAILTTARSENEVRAEALDELADHLYREGWAGASVVAYIQGYATRLRGES
jgi:hypothetical protein